MPTGVLVAEYPGIETGAFPESDFGCANSRSSRGSAGILGMLGPSQLGILGHGWETCR